MKKTGVTKDLKEGWKWIHYMVGGKMFAAICLGEANEDKPFYITLELNPLDKSYALVLHSFREKRRQEILLTTYCGL
ncbi:MAG: MmcQ/YjbR family DNA-binding protein [Clostridium sp.]|nr:MmcQ/YjbR family DNA-binding protein [Clostridium sp.]